MNLFDPIRTLNQIGRRSAYLVCLTTAMVSAVAGCTALSAAIAELPTRAAIIAGSVITIEPSGGAAVGTPSGYIPAAFGSALDSSPEVTPTPTATISSTLGPPLPPPTVVVALQPVDFEAARATAQAQGLDIAFVKIGFHRGPSGNATGWGDYVRKLNDAGVPVFVKSVDSGGPIFEVQEIMKENEAADRHVPHVLVYRSTKPEFEAIYYNLDLTPEEAAVLSWQANRDDIPKELEKEYFWLETLNEPGRLGNDGNLQIERLGRFSLATAKLAVAEGYKYAALSFSTGVPGTGEWLDPIVVGDPNDWEDPAMLDFLRYAGEHKDQVAVALHEYSLTNDYISNGYPYLIGRLQALFDTVDRHGIPRPTVLITEWGWEYNSVPEQEKAIEDIAWASWLYAAYPDVLGAAIWYLGPWCCDLDNQTQRLIEPLADYAASHYYIIDPGIGQIAPELFSPNPPTLLGTNMQGMPTQYPRPRVPVP